MKNNSIAFHQEKIISNWNQARESIIEVGRKLVEAKSSLSREDFKALIEHSLPFKAPTARKLMAIAKSKYINEGSHIDQLPNSWGTLYEITTLDEKVFQDALDSGLIRPDVMRAEIEALKKSVDEDERNKFMLTLLLEAGTTSEQMSDIKNAIHDAISDFRFVIIKPSKVAIA